MSHLLDIKSKLEINLRACEYQIYELKDTLTFLIAKNPYSTEVEETKKEISYEVGRAASLRETLQIIEKVLNSK